MVSIDILTQKIAKIAENHRLISENYTTVGKRAQALISAMSLKTTDENVVIPEGVYSIPDRAYYITDAGKYALASVTFPKTLKSIGERCFQYASDVSMKNRVVLYIPTLEMWLVGALKDLSTSFSTTKLFDGKSLVSITDEDVPPGLTDLRTHAFSYCEDLTSVELSEVLTVGEDAFYYCKSLENVNLPSATIIGYAAFESCSLLRNIYMPKARTLYTCAFRSTALEYADLPEGDAISESVFAYCSNLTDVNMPKVRFIGQSAFWGTAIPRIRFPETLSYISDYAFRNCNSLRGVAFSAAPINLHTKPFYNDANVNTVCVPWAEGEIEGAPWGMTNAEIYYSHPSNFGWCLMDYTDSEGVIHVNGQLRMYGEGETADFASNSEQIWNSKKNSVKELVIEEGIERIGTRSFAFFANLEKVTLPTTLRIIDALAFNSTAISQIDIPSGVTEIGNTAFQATPLTEITLPGVKVGKSVFNNCASLARVTFTEMPTSINEDAFSGAKLLSSVSFRGERMNTGGSVFRNYPWAAPNNLHIVVTYNHLKWWLYEGTLRIVTGDRQIPPFAYSSINKQDWRWLGDNVKALIIYNGAELIGARAFMGLKSLTSVSLPSTVKVIETYAFNACASLTEITLPAGIENIPGSPFQNCTALKTVTFEGIPLQISAKAFVGCTALTDIYVPWQKGQVANAPWGATAAAIHYSG